MFVAKPTEAQKICLMEVAKKPENSVKGLRNGKHLKAVYESIDDMRYAAWVEYTEIYNEEKHKMSGWKALALEAKVKDYLRRVARNRYKIPRGVVSKDVKEVVGNAEQTREFARSLFPDAKSRGRITSEEIEKMSEEELINGVPEYLHRYLFWK